MNGEPENESSSERWKRWHNHYILKDGVPVVADLMTWGRWFQYNQGDRIVKQEWVGRYWVSTVFLGLDHNWGDGPPILWETMVFPIGSMRDHDTDRCSGTKEQAEAMHVKMTTKMRDSEGKVLVLFTPLFIFCNWICMVTEPYRNFIQKHFCRLFHEEYWDLWQYGGGFCQKCKRFISNKERKTEQQN